MSTNGYQGSPPLVCMLRAKGHLLKRAQSPSGPPERLIKLSRFDRSSLSGEFDGSGTDLPCRSVTPPLYDTGFHWCTGYYWGYGRKTL